MTQGKATFRGHPLHLMLVSFPVAFWTGAAVTDTAALRSPDPFWARMSLVLIAAGVVVGALAAVFGYVDYRTIPMTRRVRSVATYHLITSLATLALYAAAWALRAADAANPTGIIASYAGVAALLAGGYYGSELANRHKVGIAD